MPYHVFQKHPLHPAQPPRPRAPTRRHDIIAPIVPADDQVVLPGRTRGRSANYRELAGLRERAFRKRRFSPPSPPLATSPPLKTDSVPVPTPPAEPHQAEATPRQPQQLPQPQPSPSLYLDWPAAYARCPTFVIPYHATASRQGEVVQVEVQHRRYNFRFISPYLQICVNGTWLIYGPQFPELLADVLYGNHDHVTAGLQGQKKPDLSLRRWYYWLGMRAYTTAYVESCAQCRASKSFNQKPTGLVQQLLIPSRRWSHVILYSMDLPRTTSGNDAIVILVDFLSKMAHFVPTKKTVTAADTVKVLADRLIRYHGFPDTLMLDRDPRFQSELWSELCYHFNITQAMSSSYHLQTDGQTDRVN